MRSTASTWIWIILLFLLLTGAVSLGDIFSVIFSVIGFFILLGLIGSLILRHKIRKAQQEAAQQGEEFRGYSWNFGGYHNTTRPRNPDEGKVRLHTKPDTRKRVNEDVGEYVDFKEE